MCTFRANRGGDPGNFAGDSGPYYGQLTVEVTIWPGPWLIVALQKKKCIFSLVFAAPTRKRVGLTWFFREKILRAQIFSKKPFSRGGTWGSGENSREIWGKLAKMWYIVNPSYFDWNIAKIYQSPEKKTQLFHLFTVLGRGNVSKWSDFFGKKFCEHKTHHLCIFTRVGGGRPGNIAGDIPPWKTTNNHGTDHMGSST